MRTTLLVVAMLPLACSAPSSWVLDRPADTTLQPSGQPGDTTSSVERASALIGRSGGRVLTSDGSGATFSPGALHADVDITVDQQSRAPLPSDGTPVGPTFLFGPEGQTFDAPVTVTLSFDPEKLDPGELASDIVVYTSPRDTLEFTALETTVVDRSHVSVETTHFSYFVAMHGALAYGEYVSTASDVGESPYIGDWEASGGYVLGYLVPGAKIYAKDVIAGSVYGLIPNGGYGGWDHGHHCGWVQLGKGTHIRGNGSHSSVAATCPAWNNDFSLAHGNGWSNGPGEGAHKDPTLFREGSWVHCDGCVQPAVVLPTCSDLNVYANYEPLTHTFSGVDGVELPYRGTFSTPTHPYVSAGGVKATNGYSGFGTRFVSADGYAVQIKDTRRPTSRGGHPSSSASSKITAFGFMKASCIAGSQVGNPAGAWPPVKPTCGTLEPGHSLGPEGKITNELRSCSGEYWLNLGPDGKLIETQKNVGELWTVAGKVGDRLEMQSDGNLVLYSGNKAIWATMTNGHPGAYLSLGDDGSLAVDYGATRLWVRK